MSAAADKGDDATGGQVEILSLMMREELLAAAENLLRMLQAERKTVRALERRISEMLSRLEVA
jgi:hypothetical protein